MQTTDDIDLRRYPPTTDDLRAGFAIASSDIAPAIQQAENEYGMTALISAFVMLGDILTAFGVPEEQLVELARRAARVRNCSLIRDSAASRPACSISAATFPAMA
jgi:hypothetical protein